jgi:hypothetical protein
LLAGFVWYEGETRRPNLRDVQVLTSLDQFLLENDKRDGTYLATGFLALEGKEGL